VAEHGSAGVAGTTHGASGDGLDAVEELEGGAGDEQCAGTADDDFVVGVDVRDGPGKSEEHEAHHGHEGGAKKNGGVARIACAGRIATTDGLSYANCGG